jgi:CheY-like chemotaxis protein
MAVRRILFADDDPGVQRALKRLAEKNGFELVPVLAGADIHFPDADGRDVLSRLKADARISDIPVVVWSGRDPQSDRRIALDLGAEDYVEKRDPSTLLPKIERVLLRLRDAG